MYSEINQLKATGLNKAQTARHLGINVKTVSRYWNVDADGFAEIRQNGGTRKKKLKGYEAIALKWLQEFPDISSAQVTDWLEEHYHDHTVRERTVRRMLTQLRREHHIDKQPAARQYQAVEDPPMGKQLQVDFGEKTVQNASGGLRWTSLSSQCDFHYGNSKRQTSRRMVEQWSGSRELLHTECDAKLF
jgi:hypothetical protein